MMNLDQFLAWAISQGSLGKYTDGTYIGQCVSLINQYCYRVLGVPAGSWGNAVDWANSSNPDRAYFTQVSSPQKGDVGVMGSNFGGGYGHIFIYLSPTTILEQNGRTPLRITTGSAYANPIAILRPNNQGAIMATTPDFDKVMQAGDVTNGYRALEGRDPSQQEVDYWIGGGGKPFKKFFYDNVLPEASNTRLANEDAQKFKAAMIANGKWQAAGGDFSKLEVNEVGTETHLETMQKNLEDLTTENQNLKSELGQQVNTDPNSIVITQKGWAAVWTALKSFLSKNN